MNKILISKPDTDTAIRYKCPISGFQKISGGKHKLRILWALRKQSLHYGELKRASSVFSEFRMDPRVFTRELKLLQESGLIEKTPLPGKVARTEYAMTALGKTMIPLLEAICGWSLANLDIVPPEDGACIDP
jgi:DNA-binding HxlR family transcriptional regulator